MNKITQHITHSLPFVKSRWSIILFATLWVFLLAMILKPFNFEHDGSKLWVAICYTCVVPISCCIVIYGFPLLFKTYFDPSRFTNGKFYLACFSIIVIATILCCIVAYYVAMIENREIIYSTIERFFIWFVYVSFIALFPIMIVYASLRYTKLEMRQNELKNNLELAQLDSSENIIVLGENTKVPLKISLDELLYIEAFGNNVAVHFKKDDRIKQKQFRETLVQIMDDLRDHPQIVRCHRSFVVNIENIALPLENTLPNELIVSANNAKIPVSRSYAKEVREKLIS